jgi:uncharacterized RDD family membrane protein YckC
MNGKLDGYKEPHSTVSGGGPELASTSQRLMNYIIDTSVYVVFILLLMAIDNLFVHDPDWQKSYSVFGGMNLFFFPFVYKWFMEGIFGKTLGKFITRTHVEMEQGGSIGMGQAFLRSIVRYTVIDIFSIFLSKDQNLLWHDQLTRTQVVKDDSGTDRPLAELV